MKNNEKKLLWHELFLFALYTYTLGGLPLRNNRLSVQLYIIKNTLYIL